MDVVERIARIIEPSLESMGYAVVLIKLSDGSGRKTLSVMAERTDGKNMTVEDCADISRAAGALLEVDDPIASAYDLEVCSPGIDRPLTRLKDFERHVGFDAKLETAVPIEGRRRFKGKIEGVSGETVKMKTQEGDAEVPFGNIRTAKLIMTDALMASYLKKQKSKETNEV